MNALTEIRSNHRETADDYRHFIFEHGNLRVVECRDRIQWLLQRRKSAGSGAGARWANLGYCVTLRALIRLHAHYAGADAPEFADFPAYFKPREEWRAFLTGGCE